MTDETAGAVADVMLLAAAGAAAWFILRDSRLRRVALGLVRTTVTSLIPGLLLREVRTAWRQSGEAAPRRLASA